MLQSLYQRYPRLAVLHVGAGRNPTPNPRVSRAALRRHATAHSQLLRYRTPANKERLLCPKPRACANLEDFPSSHVHPVLIAHLQLVFFAFMCGHRASLRVPERLRYLRVGAIREVVLRGPPPREPPPRYRRRGLPPPRHRRRCRSGPRAAAPQAARRRRRSRTAFMTFTLGFSEKASSSGESFGGCCDGPLLLLEIFFCFCSRSADADLL